jgi:small subunit ribosomal protein S1
MEFSSENDLQKLYEETFHEVRAGTITEGKVVAVKADGVVVDVGYKSEGFIPRGEFSEEEFSGLKEGDTVEVFVESLLDAEGTIGLSRLKAVRFRAWRRIEQAMKEDGIVEGVITGKTKGGLVVNVYGVNGFLPGSHIAARAEEIEGLMGKPMPLKILKTNTRRTTLVVSRKLFLEQERQKRKAETLKHLREGAVLKGQVKNITDYGAFIDLGGIDGLLHISDMSWGRISHPSELFQVGQEVEVLVLKFDPETEKVTLGYKQRMPDPWANVHEKYPPGSKIEGRVVSITDYGAFIRVEEGLEGLVHISELDWSARPKHPSKYLEVGQEVEALVLKADKQERRLSLSIKQLRPSPWQLVAQRYREGQVIRGRVKSLTDFGAFVELPEGVDALIHISDLSWTKHIKHPSEVLKKGQEVEAVVLSVEPEKERMALGIKQLRPDPWLREIPERFHLGDEVQCKVLRKTDFGIFVEMPGEVEGLVYASEVLETDPPLQEGSRLWARIIKIDLEGRKIGLSMRNVKAAEQ